MDSEKRILKASSIEFESIKLLLKEEYYLFLSLIDNLDTVSIAYAYISDNSWDIFSRILKNVSNHYGLNYFSYENSFGLLFDASAKHICFGKDAEF